MRVPLSWLGEFIDLDVSLEVLVDRLPMLGLGVDGVERVGDDAVLDLEIAYNRPDLMSVAGIARELAAAWDLEWRSGSGLPEHAHRERGDLGADSAGDVRASTSAAEVDGTTVAVEEPAWCPRYTAHIISGVRVSPAPGWMVRRLEACGIRSINNIVDVTNYVMLERGQPLHAFDLDRLAGPRIIVRRARSDEGLVTLDGISRTLDREMLVIADARRAVALAGIIGGSESEIGEGTGRVLLEAAAFDGPQVRRTARRLGVRTESSARFERGIDPRTVLGAARRAARLLAEVAGGTIHDDAADVCPRPAPGRRITLRLPRITRVLGIEVPHGRPERILVRLGCEVRAENGGRLVVHPPPGRLDLEREEDLIEEIARHHGYDQIPESLPVEAMQAGARAEALEAEELVRGVLIRAGLTEAMTLSLIDPATYTRLGLAEAHPDRQPVALANPLVVDHSHLRTMILPGLLDAVRVNQSRRVERIHLFEIGRTFHQDDGAVGERRTLGIAMAGPAAPRGWGADGGREIDFFDLKGILHTGAAALRLALIVEPGARPWLHPGRSARVLAKGQEIGAFGELHPDVATRWDLRGRVVAGEFWLDPLLAGITAIPRFTALPRFPAVERDIAVVLPVEVPHGAVVQAIREAAGPLLEGLDLFDVYEGAPVAPGYRSLAYRLRFRAPDQTLTALVVDPLLEAVRESLRHRFGAQVRE